MEYIEPTCMRQKVQVFYETAKGNETPSIQAVNETDRQNENSSHYDYDFILRGEVDGWPTNNMVLYWNELHELLKDIQELEGEVE